MWWKWARIAERGIGEEWVWPRGAVRWRMGEAVRVTGCVWGE